MKCVTAFRWACWVGLGLAGFLALASPARSPWERSVITIEVTRHQYDYVQPWSKRTEEHRKTGVVVGPREVLTTAEDLADRTLVRLQRNGRGEWFEGGVTWIDYQANLALLTTAATNFWRGLQPARLAERVPAGRGLQVVRWREGNLEVRKGELNRITVKQGQLTAQDHLHLELDCEIKDAGGAEAVVAENRLLGLVVAQEGNVCTALPSVWFQPILAARRRGGYRGLGYFAFVWQRSQNPALHRYFKQTGEPRGVVIVETPAVGGNQGVLRPQDILLQVDGFDIDIQGDYLDPAYGELMLENLATRRHWAGDEVPLRLWRDGAEREVRYRLPKAEYSTKLVPWATWDQKPEYLVLGGLVFQPLTQPYLRSWGPEWRRRVPFRLAYYEQERPASERPALVLLSLILPDPYNVGYQDYRYLVVSRVNGQPVVDLAGLQSALRQPREGFHLIEFARGDSLQRLVLDAGLAPAATQRVLQRYGIDQEAVIVRN